MARLEGAYEHMATKADVATLSGDFKVIYTNLDARLTSLETSMSAVLDALSRIDQRLSLLESASNRLASGMGFGIQPTQE